MKKVLFCLLISFSFLACNDQEELFELTYEVDVFYTAGLTQFQAHFQDIFALDTNIEAILVANNRTQTEISSIVPKSAEIVNIQSSEGLDFIQNISIRVFDGSQFNPTDQENITEVFFRDNVPQDRRSFIDLLPALPEVQDRLFEEDFNLSIRTELRVPPPTTIEARLRVTFVAR